MGHWETSLIFLILKPAGSETSKAELSYMSSQAKHSFRSAVCCVILQIGLIAKVLTWQFCCALSVSGCNLWLPTTFLPSKQQKQSYM